MTSDGVPAADALADAVRQRIIDGRYPGGERITEERIAAEFTASRMSVREALRVLAAEGYLTMRPYFGTFVTQMTAQQATDLLEVQAGLEAMAAELAAGRRTDVDLEELRFLVEQGRCACAQNDRSASAALHGRFHSVLARAAGNESLGLLMQQVRFKVDWVYASTVQRPAEDAWEEHSAIVDAIEAGDPVLATEAARDHVQQATAARSAH